ncbi:MAG TPA: cation diffusion facilitator family transporter [Elusimicrobiota bacterium]|jgi:cobalt-zinc-cadmium efflux system protein|nr:cation diffusion facilitator family transporter [Elusimicrobiota bacterium]
MSDPHSRRGEDGGMRPLTGAIALTAVIFCAELAGGWWSGSLALLADATHVAIDLLGLGLSLFAAMVGRMPADPRRTFGYRRVEVLAALGNAVALMVATGFILREAWARWQFATPVAAKPMMFVAGLGVACNLAAAGLLWRGSRGNLNLRGALLHVLSDAAGAFGALLAGFVILETGWYEADAVVSALICVGIVFTAYWLLRDSIHILLEGAPPHLDLEDIRAALAGLDGVKEVHDLHLWSLTQGQEAMSGHLVTADGRDSAAVLKAGQDLLVERFSLTHVTLQIEREETPK